MSLCSLQASQSQSLASSTSTSFLSKSLSGCLLPPFFYMDLSASMLGVQVARLSLTQKIRGMIHPSTMFVHLLVNTTCRDRSIPCYPCTFINELNNDCLLIIFSHCQPVLFEEYDGEVVDNYDIVLAGRRWRKRW